MYESVLDESSSVFDSIPDSSVVTEVYSIDDSEVARVTSDESFQESAVTPVGDSSLLDDEPLEVSRLLSDPGEAAAEVTGDTLIMAQLEVIDHHIQSNTDAVDSLSDKVFVNTRALDTVNENIASFAVDFNNYVDARDEKDTYIIGYLHIFLITLFTVLGVVFISKLAKWIENTLCDR